MRQGPRHRYVYEDQTAQGRRQGWAARPGARVAEQHNEEEGLSYFFDYGGAPVAAGDGPAASVRSSTVVRDSLGRTTTYHFEGEGGLKRLVRLTGPDGAEQSYRHDSAGRRLSATDALGRTTWWRYDGAGRLLGVQGPDGRSTQQHWGAAGSAQDGLLLASQDAAGLRTHFRYDDWGRLVEVAMLPEGRTDEAATLQALITRFEYEQPRQDAGTGAVTFPPHTLAWCDQPVAMIDAQGGRSQYAYNACGQITRHTDCSGRSQTWRHGAWGEVVEAVDALGQRTHDCTTRCSKAHCGWWACSSRATRRCATAGTKPDGWRPSPTARTTCWKARASPRAPAPPSLTVTTSGAAWWSRCRRAGACSCATTWPGGCRNSSTRTAT